MENYLVPNDVYLLKWSSIGRMGDHLFSVKCEFIKYFDDTYCTDDIEYNGHGAPPRELIGSIFNEAGERIIYDFDNPLYPYSNFNRAIHANNCNIGLFKIISIQKVLDYGRPHPLSTSLFVNTNLLTRAFIKDGSGVMDRGTLLWVDLDEVSEIIEANRILEDKAVQSTRLPQDIQNELNDLLLLPRRFGGKSRSSSRGGKSKKSRGGKSNKSSRIRKRTMRRRIK